MKKFEIAHGGCTIACRLYEPEKRLSDKVIVLCHEFGMSVLSTARYARGLCKMGLTVYIFDFLGSGAGRSRGRDSRDMSVLTECEDLKCVLSFVRQAQPECDVVLGGCSQGGLVAALCAAELADDIDSLFLVYPALCIPDDVRSGRVLDRRFDKAAPPESILSMGYVRVGRRYIDDALTLDPWQQICSFKKPVLILHGERDGIVPLSYAEKAAQLYPNAKLLVYKGARHVFPDPHDVSRACRDIAMFVSASPLA